MTRLVLCVAALLIGLSSAQWITAIEGISMDLLLTTKFGTQSPVLNRFLTVDNAFRPLNDRTIYRGWDVSNYYTGAAPFYPSTEYLTITGQNVAGVTAWLIPYTPEAYCGAAPGAATPCTSTTVGFGIDTTPIQSPCLLTPVAGGATSTTILFQLPLNRLSMHLHQAALLCVSALPPRTFTRTNSGFGAPLGAAGATLSNIATNLVFQVNPKCSTLTTVDTNIGATPLSTLTGTITAITDCPTIAALTTGAAVSSTLATSVGLAFHEFASPTPASTQPVTFDYVDRTLRTVCCGYRPTGLTDQSGIAVPAEYGLCINPAIDSCCSSANDNQKILNVNAAKNPGGRGKVYNPFQEKCCYGGRRDSTSYQSNLQIAFPSPGQPVVISYIDDFCPCTADRVTDFCGSLRQCCTFSKYPELVPTILSNRVGRCYDPSTEQCCETGETFNPGFYHCCLVNGVQSLDTPCPCDGNEDCRFNQTCCVQRFTAPVEVQSCSAYSNYPTGTGPVDSQSCLGRCIDSRFQICCNGYACVDNYEVCCNSTCCNKFSNRCTMERSRVTPFADANSVLQYFETCTTNQSLTPIRGVMAFLLPIALLLATFLGLAFSLFFAKRQNQMNPISGYEKAILTFAFLIIFFGWPLYFSPLYRYGVVIVWTGFFSIVAALAGIRGLVLAAAFVQLLLLVYIFDPFGGNEILNLAHTRAPENAFGAAYSGIFLSINALHRGESVAYPGARCTAFYAGWFERTGQEDPWVNPPDKYTFGFCAREWFGALLIIEIINTLWIIILFLVTIVAHIKNVLVKKVISQNPLHF